MKKVISIIILIVMFTAVISVKAELSEIVEDISEELELEYTYEGIILDERNPEERIVIKIREQEIITYDEDCKLKEIYKYQNKQDFTIAAITVIYKINDWTKMSIYKGGISTAGKKAIKEIIISGGNV